MTLRRLMMAGGGAGSYLDGLATVPYSVLSLRKQISSASLAIRVRRSSDNTEQDIGFSGNALDTASLASFVGAGNGFVRTFYDQTGNGLHGQQSTNSLQPRIVSGGVYDGKLVFDGSDDYLSISSFNPASQFVGLYAKLMCAHAASFKMLFELSPDGQATSGGLAMYVRDTATGWVMAAGNTSGGRSTVFTMSPVGTLSQVSALFDRSLTGLGETKLWIASSSKTPTAASTGEQTGNFTTNTMFIGRRNGTSFAAPMWLETVAFYNADTSALRSSIETFVA